MLPYIIKIMYYLPLQIYIQRKSPEIDHTSKFSFFNFSNKSFFAFLLLSLSTAIETNLLTQQIQDH